MMAEEMAEEYAEGMAMYYESVHGSVPSQFEKYLKKAYLAGLKAVKPKWHKVSDGDLPKETEFIESDVLLLLVQLKGTKQKRYELGRYNFSADAFIYGHLEFVEDVVAWCEIPTYTEVIK